jgi:thioredoxin reductase
MSKKLKKDERQSIIMFDVLIIGGGVSGISCALVLGSAKIKILQIKGWRFHPSKSSSLQEAVFNNAYGFLQDHWAPICWCKRKHLSQLYLILLKYQRKKSCGLKGNLRLHGDDKQNTYKSKIIVVAIGAANTFQLMG